MLHDYVSKFTFPICDMSTNAHNFIATSMLCKYYNKLFLLNAGHTVTDYFENKRKLSLRLYNNRYIDIGCFNTSIFDSNGMDLAVSYIDNDKLFDNISFNLNFFNINKQMDYMVFFGYPSSSYKPHAMTPRADFIRYTSKIIDLKNISSFSPDIDDRYHIVGELIKENVTCVKENGEEIIKSHLPSLKGLSGGPVFGIYKNSIDIHQWLGIGIRCYEKEKFIVCLRYNVIISALNHVLSIL